MSSSLESIFTVAAADSGCGSFDVWSCVFAAAASFSLYDYCSGSDFSAASETLS